MSHSACHIQHVTFSMSHSACHAQHVTLNMSHLGCHTQHVLFAGHIHHVVSSMSYSTCYIEYVTSSMLPVRMTSISCSTSLMRSAPRCQKCHKGPSMKFIGWPSATRILLEQSITQVYGRSQSCSGSISSRPVSVRSETLVARSFGRSLLLPLCMHQSGT